MAGDWRRYEVDLDQVRAYRLGTTEGALSELLIDITALPQPATAKPVPVELLDPTLVGGPVRASGATAREALTIDGRNIQADWTWSPSLSRFVARVGPVFVGDGAHELVSGPPLPVRMDGAVIGSPPGEASPTDTVDDVRVLSDSELTMSVDGPGGLLVFPSTFSSGWRLALGPASQAPSGVALQDVLHLQRSWIPQDDHVPVDVVFNGWVIPPGSYRATLVYVPEAISEASALLWAVLSIALVAGTILTGRPYKR